MISKQRKTGISLAIGVSLVTAGGFSVAASTGPQSAITLSSAQAASTESLTATMWESSVPQFTFADTSWSPQSGESATHRYRIAISDGSIVDRQPTEGVLLTEAEQSAVYTAKGFGGQWPYEFNWSVVLCQTAQDPYDLLLKPELKSVQQWDLTKISGYPTPPTQSEYYDWQISKLQNGSGWTSVAEPWSADFQTNSGFGAQNSGSYYDEASLSVYADFECEGAAEPRVVPLLDASGVEYTSRTISLSGARVKQDPTVPNTTVPIDLIGHHVMVTGYLPVSLNAATWGIAKIADSTVAQGGSGTSQPQPLAETGVSGSLGWLLAGVAMVVSGIAFVMAPLVKKRRRLTTPM